MNGTTSKSRVRTSIYVETVWRLTSALCSTAFDRLITNSLSNSLGSAPATEESNLTSYSTFDHMDVPGQGLLAVCLTSTIKLNVLSSLKHNVGFFTNCSLTNSTTLHHPPLEESLVVKKHVDKMEAND